MVEVNALAMSVRSHHCQISDLLHRLCVCVLSFVTYVHSKKQNKKVWYHSPDQFDVWQFSIVMYGSLVLYFISVLHVLKTISPLAFTWATYTLLFCVCSYILRLAVKVICNSSKTIYFLLV